MGRAIDVAATDAGWTVRARIDAHDSISSESLRRADVAIEFTTAAAAPDVVRACLEAGCSVVSGTTGWSGGGPGIEQTVEASRGAFLWTPNFALGAHLLAAAAAYLGRALRDQPAWDAAVIETHHAAKRDAPSGTARSISDRASAAWGRAIPVTSVRVGQVPGVHEVIFDAPFEQLRLTHSVRDRRVFAEGALTAARWLAGRRGVFSMDDVVRALLGEDPGGAEHGVRCGSSGV